MVVNVLVSHLNTPTVSLILLIVVAFLIDSSYLIDIKSIKLYNVYLFILYQIIYGFNLADENKKGP